MNNTLSTNLLGTKPEFTPGPYFSADIRAVVPCCIVSNEGMVANVVKGLKHRQMSDRELAANSRLMATSAELFHVAVEVLQSLENLGLGECYGEFPFAADCPCTICKVRAAVAKVLDDPGSSVAESC